MKRKLAVGVIILALLGCEPVESKGGGRADRAAHPSNPPASSNENKVKVDTGDPNAKVCSYGKRNKTKKVKGVTYKCLEDPVSHLYVWKKVKK